LQRKYTKWGVFDVMKGNRVADMRVKYIVSTTPGPVLDPMLTEVQQTELKITWTPPQNDHGAPVLGYKVSIMLGQSVNEGPRWHTLCELTKTLNPVYMIANLTGNKVYTVDVRAVNKVGVGDACEFQVATAPVNPDPPSKPWIEEARDGYVNLAWMPSGNDGGSPIHSYKVIMWKILGASKWNPFGPGESNAVKVDMGNVEAVQGEQQEPLSMYSDWIGPLENAACQYKFQIISISAAGMSAGSEHSNPIYT
jgi:hypothetical protein